MKEAGKNRLCYGRAGIALGRNLSKSVEYLQLIET